MSDANKGTKKLVLHVDLAKMVERYNERQKELGNDIRLTQEMLKDETAAFDKDGKGVSQSTISNWMNGYRMRVDLEVAASLLMFFRQIFPDATLNDLISESYE